MYINVKINLKVYILCPLQSSLLYWLYSIPDNPIGLPGGDKDSGGEN
jgi:hypothetical protein